MERIEFEGSGGESLAGRLELPGGKPRAYAIFAHCFTCSKDAVAASRVSKALAERGVAVLRFDFTGLGQSGGEFANTNFSSNTGDLLRAAAWLRENHQAPRLLVGHSLGGAAVLAAACEIPESRAIVTIGAPAEPAHVVRLLEDRRGEIETSGEAEVDLAGRRFKIKRQFLEDLEANSMRERIAKLGRALLVMHSPVDEIVGIDNASAIYTAAKHPKSFVSLDDANHLVTNPRDAAYVAEVVASWAARYMPEAPSTATATRDAETSAGAAGAAPQVAPNEVLVRENGRGRFGQDVFAGKHALLADEPPSVGGGDTGPTPYDYLLTALGSCVSMTLRMYASRKKWPLEHVAVRLRHKKIHAQDCEHCEQETGKIDRIDREITLEGPLDDEQRARLLEIADRCPVHRTLHGTPDVLTREAPPAG